MKLERYADSTTVAEKAADRVAATLEERPEAVILLPAGGTPIPLYVELVARSRAGRLDLTRARLFQLDEIVGVAADDPRGFHQFLRTHLLDPLDLEAYLLNGRATDPVAEIAGHAQRLEELGGADLALLGIGRNGHVAFNEPGTDAHEGGRVVALSATTREGLERAFPEEVPQTGLTLGLSEIGAARQVVLMATGPSKADVLEQLFAGAAGPQLPAAWLRDHGDFTVLADASAAGAVAN